MAFKSKLDFLPPADTAPGAACQRMQFTPHLKQPFVMCQRIDPRKNRDISNKRDLKQIKNKLIKYTEGFNITANQPTAVKGERDIRCKN